MKNLQEKNKFGLSKNQIYFTLGEVLVKIQSCPNCGSIPIVKNGHTVYGAQRCLCHSCGKTRVIERKAKVDRNEMIQKAFTERLGLRGVCRVFQLSFTTLYILLHLETQSLAPFRCVVLQAGKGDVLELDELCSFVGKKAQKRWLWAAMNRPNRQVVAYVIGDRSSSTLKRLIRKIPLEYLECCSYRDLWKSYGMLLCKGSHQMEDKPSSETAHIEKWNCTLRQRLSRYVRRSLAYSKLDKFHHLMTKLFIFK